ncbi:hypothetical protein [Ekhidna sp.]|uniref:hypothetical protein n=1 Tax=Ekhidna sp. TaxID=2608089 RepID=UPI003BA8D6A2
MKIIQDENIQLHLNRILDNSTAIRKLTDQMEFRDFEQNKQIKETAYAQLQEVGQAAYEIESQKNEPISTNFDIGVLSSLRNVRYNMEAEMDHYSIWGLIKNDLIRIGEKLEQSEIYTR